MTIKAIIFDMDGVLYNSIPMHLKIWEMVFSKRNIPFSLNIFEEYNGNSSLTIANKLISKFNLNEKAEDIFNEKVKLELSMRDEGADLFPQTIDVLTQLKNSGFKIAIATGALKHTVDYVKKRFNLDKFADVFVESEDVEHGKPSPDIFLLAAKKLGVEPNLCAVVEDAVNGISAANSAGMTSVAITNTFSKKVFINNANFIINNLDELTNIVRN